MVIITGASKGIGKFLFETFLQNNENVLGTYYGTIPSDHLSKFGKVDVKSVASVAEFINFHEKDLENITLINCAGISVNGFTHKISHNDWQNVLETNLFGTFNFIRSVLPIMRNQKFGRIINFSSVVAIKPTQGVSAYAASKSALWGLSKSIASENASLNITINTINLGYSELGMIEEVPDEFLNKIISQIPSGELCSKGDIWNTVNFLRTTKYINGSSIDLNGGLT